jgi:predicted nucleic acid-binding protein
VLFEKVIIPPEVRDELSHPQAPEVVREWISAAPAWLEVRSSPTRSAEMELGSLDEGERAALMLAMSLDADLLLLDDRAGARVARRRGFRVTGTLGVLMLAAEHGLLDLADAFERLKRTNFRYRREIMDKLLERHAG